MNKEDITCTRCDGLVNDDFHCENTECWSALVDDLTRDKERLSAENARLMFVNQELSEHKDSLNEQIHILGSQVDWLKEDNARLQVVAKAARDYCYKDLRGSSQTICDLVRVLKDAIDALEKGS